MCILLLDCCEFLSNCNRFVRLHGVMYRETNIYSYSVVPSHYTIIGGHCMPVSLLHCFYSLSLFCHRSEANIGLECLTSPLRAQMHSCRPLCPSSGCPHATVWLSHRCNTHSYESVHTSHSSTHNECRQCVCYGRIHRRDWVPACDVGATPVLPRHSTLCVWDTCGSSTQWSVSKRPYGELLSLSV